MKIICVGGSTLGSVTPLLAVIVELRRQLPDVAVEWWGTFQGPERQFITTNNIKFLPLISGKWRRYWSWANWSDLFKIFLGFLQALWRFGLNRPDVFLSAGSYVSVPAGWAAWCYGIPLIIHQQDVRASLANKLLVPLARVITVTWPDSLRDYPAGKTIVTGNPARFSLLDEYNQDNSRRNLGLSASQPVVLVLGGGTGALFLNQLITAAIGKLVEFCQVVHLTGLGKSGAKINHPNYRAFTLAIDIYPLLRAADVVVARAGMGTITELSVLRKASLIVPLPESHQEDNAAALKQHHASIILAQKDLTAEVFIDTVKRLLADSDQRQKLGANLNALFPAGAADRIARLVKQTACG